MKQLNLSDPQSIIIHVESGEYSMQSAPDKVKDNKDLALKLLKSHHIKLNDFSTRLKDDEDVVFLALEIVHQTLSLLPRG